MNDSIELRWTGERIIPEDDRYMYRRHLMAYRFAIPFCRGQCVLDAGCGEGYGSFLLAESAASVAGIDLSADAVIHACRKYTRANLAYRVMDATRMDFPAASFDVAVSFQAIEHMHDPDAFLREINRILRRPGLAIISTPNKSLHPNHPAGQFHAKEYRHDEFKHLLENHFVQVECHGVRFASAASARKLKLVDRLPPLDVFGIRKLFPALGKTITRAIERQVELEISAEGLESALDIIGVCHLAPGGPRNPETSNP